MGGYLIIPAAAALMLMIIYEYGWPPIEMFDTMLRTEKSRNIARIVGWVLTAGLLLWAGLRLWSIFR